MRTFVQILAMMIPLALLGCGGDSEKAQSSADAPKAGAPAASSKPAAAVVHELPGDPVAGKAAYEKVCLACHAADGRGNGGITGADLVGDKSRLAKSNEELYKSVAEGQLDGTPPMPPQLGPLTEQEIKDALAYVRATFGDS
jgi:mono/diheme cytochrome c family protein